MNSLLRARLVPRAFAFSLLLLAMTSLASAADRNARDIAIIDRILAGVKPGQTMVELGDVGMTPAQLQAIRDGLAGGGGTNIVTPPGTAFKWPGGLVYFRFANDAAITAARKQAFRDGIAEWTAFANLQFIELPSPPTAPGQTAYITVQNDPFLGGGFSSSVGRSGAEQFITIGGNAWNRGTIIHEMGHALGLWHEHQREDRDTYVDILWENIPDPQEGNFVKISTLGGGSGVSLGAYDFESVMHYAQTTFGEPPGSNTILPKPAFSQYLNRLGAPFDRPLSKLDRAGIAQMYGAPATAPGAVVTNTKDSGSGSLRTAIYFAWDRSSDVAPTPTTITFQIPTSDVNFNAGVFTIRPTALLVAPGDETTIDGATQTTFTGNTNASGPEIVINGAQIVAPETYSAGLRLRATGCVVKNLVINGFNQWGIQIDGTQAAGNVVRSCYIGTDAAGTAAVANAFPGIEISGGAHGNTIGGTTAAHRNVISGNAHNGVQIIGAGTDSNIVQGNFIGTNATGTAALPNLYSGIEVLGGAKFTMIGGTAAGAGNLIAGNPLDGVRYRGAGTDNNVAQGNFIGTNATGTGPVPNQNAGVRINEGAKANVVGGTSAAARNILSGNTHQGVIVYDPGTDNNSVLGNYIGLRADGTAALANGSAGIGIYAGAKTNTIGSTVAGNVISGNAREGVLIADAGSTGNAVIGNFIGLNPAGTAPIGNAFSGVAIYAGAQSNTIGGTNAAARNIISGNGNEGVVVSGTNSNANAVLGNYIGTNAAGSAALANGFSGVSIYAGAQANIIGGASAASRNIISGNTGPGVLISNSGSSGNSVLGNFVGTNPAGAAAIPNGGYGVAMWGGAQANQIGGTAPGAGNLISGNADFGVNFSDGGTTGNFLRGNLIGTNAAGSAALGNGGGVAFYGPASGNIVGGATPGSRNVISGNGGYGVFVAGDGSNNHQIAGNTIGWNAAGTAALGNTGPGVVLQNNISGNLIGGTAPGSANLIAGNGAQGVVLYGFNVVNWRNAILGNSIFDNAQEGIATYNGANNGQAAPTLTSAVFGTAGNPGGVTIGGSLTSTPSTSFRLEFFAAPAGDPSGAGEGKTFLGAGVVTTNGAGVFAFSAALAPAIPAGHVVSATATDLNGNTSQFATNRTVTVTDTDADGMPNAWETANGLSTSVNDASDDFDGDGDTNVEELRAGTDPRNPASRFTLAIDRIGGDARLTLPTASGRTYRIEFTSSLFPSDWRLLSDQLSGTGAALQLTDPAALTFPARSYRAIALP